MSAPENTLRVPDSKLAHLDACLTGDVGYKKTTGLESWDFENQAAANISLDHINVETTLAGKKISAPIMIAPMTGGVARGHELNRMLFRAAEKWQLPVGVGSQRVALENAQRAAYFHIREDAPSTTVFANVGAGQFCKGWGVEEAKRAVDMIEADALYVHLNPIQEACQGGDVDFRNLTNALATICKGLKAMGIPVFAREVGFGLSEAAARTLIDCGVAGLDCAGAGGTSWAKVEALCAADPAYRKYGMMFGEWGIPTAEAIQNVRRASKDIPLVATGGIRNGLDVAKALALGADVASLARPMLQAADVGPEAVDQFITELVGGLKIAMFGIGAADLDGLKHTPLLIKNK
ncbi:MAG: type 2 isopentenyl-diphosphate Delta-isomerase [Myxococcales bacterium]|nr:type 2 isopentenyl-diphosphate Delta-isomerase [Myxococcales bacterium]|tara:strand:- start:440 stop:1489 length:1050 start_codon:yes stop_codon:yes gene_type:complete